MLLHSQLRTRPSHELFKYFYTNKTKLKHCRRVATKCKISNETKSNEHHEHYYITVRPSRFHWNKFKDLIHLHVMLGLIPIGLITFFANVFVGPAQLEPIPEDREPRHWEYHRHPIKRFIARYMHPSPQQEYEKALHNIYEENEKAQMRLLETDIRAKMSERNDYKAYYYRPMMGKYLRVSKEAADYLESVRGD